MFRRLSLAIFMLTAGLASASCGSPSGELLVENAWARETPEGAPNGAIYLTIRNNTGSDDQLISAASSLARHVGLHTSGEEDGMMRMRPIDSVAIASGSTAQLKPAGDHIMLMGLEKRLEAGTRIPLTLQFEIAGEKTIDVRVIGMTDSPD
ncbi:hypothetical protein JCM17844_08790 [Iodidimonas gelatinilytica]|uniref:Copper chaperone PCu(A)C n=1 Tax=Iodidimonas gelatinilytica TaxID=1236966 RepID=A0A5A7MUH3_9PROT|nr:copper chaperone PCu(A)C [Iodidimonas gelatinilytica]GEQ97242.1 hypothetical protein JCM17844_08790 [Iodidimonas gelatinilytica]GEQ99571.1 hypothetical protein JCM17845_01950 [Iodidimonas gelatinilytica]